MNRTSGPPSGPGGDPGGSAPVRQSGPGGRARGTAVLGGRSRLASLALSGLMEVSSDEALDRLVAVAATAVDAPVVLVSLVDQNRQHFPSQLGLGEPWAARAETPLSHSFCQHVVRSGDPLIITDATESAVVAGNRAIDDLGVRAYAGFPLRDAAGNVLGSFCVIDGRAREWTERELETVAGLGQLAQSEIRSRIALARSQARLTLLGEVTAGLQTRFEVEQAVRRLCAQLVPAFADSCMVDLIEMDGGFRLAALAGADDELVAVLERIEAERPRQQNPRSVVRRVLETGRGERLAIFDEGTPARDVPDPGRRAAYLAAGLTSVMVVPIRSPQRVVGALTLHRLSDSPAFEATDLDLAEEIGVRLGVALDNAQALAREHETAVAFQANLLTPPPAVDDLDVAVRYRPSNRWAEVGGDWYDVLRIGDRIGLAVGDVSGHDLQAAASMGQVRAVLRAYALEEVAPSTVLDRVCRLVRTFSDDETVTAFYGILGPRRPDGGRTLHHARAGHPPPILLRAGRPPAVLEEGLSPMIGVETTLRRTVQTELEAGDTLVLYTDGLVEHRGRPVSTGLDEMVAELADVPDRAADAVAEYLLTVMRPEDGWDDDVALLVVHLR